jgi:hypothetical protein
MMSMSHWCNSNPRAGGTVARIARAAIACHEKKAAYLTHAARMKGNTYFQRVAVAAKQHAAASI